ncbi:MAG: hypothetical protein V4573_17725 [Pseudomonadota bacterium]
MKLTHSCHANGCSWATERWRFMCRAHWIRLPSAMQGAILDAYRAHKTEAERCRSLAYMTACANAVEHIARLEGKPEANSYRRVASILEKQAAAQLPQMTANIQALIENAPRPSGVHP